MTKYFELYDDRMKDLTSKIIDVLNENKAEAHESMAVLFAVLGAPLFNSFEFIKHIKDSLNIDEMTKEESKQ